MERTRIAKVDGVKLIRRGQSVEGTLHLTPHHLIFSHIPDSTAQNGTVPALERTPKPRSKELWITYPIIQTCTLRLAHPTSHLPSSIRLRCRDFTFVCFCFVDENKARDVYDSIRAWTCKLGRIDKLYAFSYQPPKPEKDVDGWNIYDARLEWNRLGISEKGTENGWRISTINSDYGFSPTYPALLPVPSEISDNTLNYAGKYRSRVRLPVLTYLHPVNHCSITRSSQPLVGVRQNRSIQDETLLLKIFSTPRTKAYKPASTSADGKLPEYNTENDPTAHVGCGVGGKEDLEDEMIAEAASDQDKPRVYGAQQHNLIVDARPTVNAYAMQAVGMGSENMDHYPFATKVYLGIDNIHVMRSSLEKVIGALKESDVTPLAPNREALARSGWLKHIANMLDGVGLIVRQVGLQHSHVLIHCSDGWDRTSQLSGLSQLCLDPFYRTLDGFVVLVEKDWLSFGHMFADRSGFLSSEKWFEIENERTGGETNRQGFGNAGVAGNALESAFLSAKGFFNKEHNKSRESFGESDGETNAMDEASPTRKSSAPGRAGDKHVTKVKETSPVFHQFLDATYQLMCQHPSRFEFNERFLRRLLYHLYSCQYGTFLYNSEKERMEAKVKSRTASVWDYFLSRRKEFTNPRYESEIDDHERGKERLIFPRTAEVRWWSELFGRADAEMNGPPGASTGGTADGSTGQETVLTGVETADRAVGPGATDAKGGGWQGETRALSEGMAALGVGRGKSAAGGQRSSWGGGGSEEQEEMEIEMEMEMGRLS